MTDKPAGEGDLTREIAALRAELRMLNSHRFVRIYNSVPRFLAFNFARGLALGLGTVVGATLLLSMLVGALSQIEFLPIIGDWAAEIAARIREAQ
jgi:hypothetical protein